MDNASLDLAMFMKKFLEEQMGYFLDLARTSDMGDRQYAQFERSVKASTRKSITNSITILNQYKNYTVDMSILQKQEEDKKK